jgi:hypothetical protein
VTAAPPRKRYRLPPPHPGFAAGFPHSPLAAWQQLPLVAAGLAAARLSGLHPHPHLQPAALPPFMPLSASPSPALPPAAAMAAAAAAAAAAATAGMSLGRGWDHAANDGGGGGGEQENKAAAVAELMQIMQGAQQGLGLPPPRWEQHTGPLVALCQPSVLLGWQCWVVRHARQPVWQRGQTAAPSGKRTNGNGDRRRLEEV